MSYRKSNFKIGQIHSGDPTKNKSQEAWLRNYLYGVGMLVVGGRSKESCKIRLVGYEVPIYSGKSRVECIDLVGYDQNFKPWLIELKKAESKERLEEVVMQIQRYSEAFEKGIRKPIEQEIGQRYLWPKFRFSKGMGKMILADRSFFKKSNNEVSELGGILICSFARVTNEETLRKTTRGEVKLKLEC